MNKSKINKIAAKTLKDGIERRKKLRNCPKFGDHLTSNDSSSLQDEMRELCYAIEELPASEQQTKISVMASGLNTKIEQLESAFSQCKLEKEKLHGELEAANQHVKILNQRDSDRFRDLFRDRPVTTDCHKTFGELPSHGWSESAWREYNAASPRPLPNAVPPARLSNNGTVEPPQQTEAGKLE